MWRVKQLADPDGVLAPGVVLNRDPGAHLREPEDDAGDRGVGDDLRRVRLLRAGLPEPQPDDDAAPADRAAAGDGAPARGLAAAARRCSRSTSTTALETCAADGSCQLACPVGIDTGKLVKELRARRHTRARREALALATAKRWGTVEGATAGRPAASAGRWRPPDQARPGAARRRPAAQAAARPSTTGAAAVYVPSCTNRIFGSAAAGSDRSGPGWPRRWSRSPPRRPAGLDPRRRARQLLRAALELERASARPTATRRTRWSSGSGAGAGRGRCRSSIDATSCTQGGRRPRRRRPRRGERRAPRQARDPRLGRLGARPPAALARGRRARSARATVHPTCATRHLGLAHRLGRSPARSPTTSTSPPSATCCGFAGDRGISHPELTAAATAPEASELAGRDFDAHLSSNRTCEIGLEPRHRRALRVRDPPARAFDRAK